MKINLKKKVINPRKYTPFPPPPPLYDGEGMNCLVKQKKKLNSSFVKV